MLKDKPGQWRVTDPETRKHGGSLAPSPNVVIDAGSSPGPAGSNPGD